MTAKITFKQLGVYADTKQWEIYYGDKSLIKVHCGHGCMMDTHAALLALQIEMQKDIVEFLVGQNKDKAT